MLAKAKSDQDRQLLQKQFDRMYAPASPLKQLFRGVTTNPPLSLQAIQEDVPYWGKVARELIDQNPGIDPEGLFWKLYKRVVKRGSDMYLPLFNASGFKEGFLSGQVDPRKAFDKQTMIQQAEEIASLNPNVMVKVPGTQQGYEVIEHLTAKGISTTIPSLLFCPNFWIAPEASSEALKPPKRTESISPNGAR
jgi:transaldolase